MLYPWHPLYGKELTVTGERNPRSVVMVVCSSDDACDGAGLEVPPWMFDAAACCRFQSAPSAQVDISALRALRALLQAARSHQRDVVEAQHQSTIVGGSDAQTGEDNTVPVSAVSGSLPKSAAAKRNQSEASSSSRPSPTQTRGPRPGRTRVSEVNHE